MVFFQVLILEEVMKLHLISAQNKSIANNKSITNTHEIGSSVEMLCCFFFYFQQAGSWLALYI